MVGASGAERDDRLLMFVRSTERAASSDQRLAGICHPAMHKLGRAEGGRAASSNRAPAFPTGSSQLCTAGYVHGVAEGYLTGTPDAQVARVFPALCHVTKAREGCAHGVGHALLRAQSTLPAHGAARAASSRCKELPLDFPINCMNGVYMELAMRTKPEVVPPLEYVKACRATPDVEPMLACWGYMTTNLGTNDISLTDAPSWCARAELPGQFTCIEQYGRDLGAAKVDRCSSSGPIKELRERCVDGAIGLQVGSGHVSSKKALSACQGIESRSLRKHCVSAVARYTRGRARVENT